MIDVRKSEEYIIRHRPETIEILADFFLTDTLLFWSDVEELNLLQQKVWQPLFDICKKQYGLVLHKTTGLDTLGNEQNRPIFVKMIQNLNDKELTACFLAASESKSSLLGYLMVKKQINASEVFSAAFIEELYQNKYWGEDEAAKNKHRQVKETLSEIEKFLAA